MKQLVKNTLRTITIAISLGICGTAICAEMENADYKGWKDAVKCSNGAIALTVVPSIGKIMGFSLVNGENIIWNNKELEGLLLKDAAAKEPMFGWANFGGDRFWVVQQSDNAQLRGGKSWPPDEVFDGAPWACKADGSGALIMESRPSIEAGVKAWRKIELDSLSPMTVMRQKITAVDGVRKRPINMIQNVTTINRPDMVIAKLAKETCFKYSPLEKSPFPNGISPLTFPKESLSRFLTVKDGYVFLSQPEKGFTGKFYADVKDGWICAIYGDTAYFQLFKYEPESYYPDGGCSVEVYVSDYFELELISPAKTLRPGEEISFDVAWAVEKIGIQDSLETAKKCEEHAKKLLKKSRFR
ncbi:MAG: hypothetical protein WCS96_14090 [Victivallales bacterium]